MQYYYFKLINSILKIKNIFIIYIIFLINQSIEYNWVELNRNDDNELQLAFHNSVIYDSKIYSFGGEKDKDNTNPTKLIVNDLLDIKNDTIYTDILYKGNDQIEQHSMVLLLLFLECYY